MNVLLLLLAAWTDARPRALPGDAQRDQGRAWKAEFSAAAPRWRREREADLLRLTIEVEPDIEKGRVEAVATLRFKALKDGLERLSLDAVRLSVSKVEDAAGKALEHEVLPEGLTVQFPKPLARGAEAAVRIRYSAEPKMGLYFFRPDPARPGEPLMLWSQGEPEEARHWIPVFDYPNERTATELLVTVPDGLEVVSNGELKARRPGAKPGTTLFHWAQEKPHVPYLITLAAARFAVVEDRWKELPLRYYVPPDRKGDVERSFGRTKDMLDWFTSALQTPYPWAQYAQVVAHGFMWGGMENTSATTLNERALLDEKARLDGDRVEDLLAHELAHQWFGDLLTCKDWAHIWLNEGFASYFQALYRRHWLGEADFALDMREKAEDYFGEGYRRPIVSASYERPEAMFDGHSYDKGAWVLHMLRAELGDDDFWRSLRLYVQRHHDDTVETEDLRQAVEDATGRPMQAFFDQWVYGPGHPELAATFRWDAEKKTAKLKVTQKQAKPFRFTLPVDLGDGEPKKAEVTKAEHEFEWPAKRRPKELRVDPDGTVLKDMTLDAPLDLLERSLDKDGSVPARLDAAAAIEKRGGPEAVKALSRCLAQDPFWGLRARCAAALGRLGGPAARDALAAAVRQESPKVRRAAAEALGGFPLDPKAHEALAALSEDPSWLVRRDALSAMGSVRAEGAAALLTAALEKDSWLETVRRGAAAGLASLRDPATLPALRAWSEPGKPVQARRWALPALARVAELGEAEKTRLFLERLLDVETDLAVLQAAAGALAALGDPKAIPALERLAARHPHGWVRESARDAAEGVREGKKGKTAELASELDKLRKDLEKLSGQVEKLDKGK